VKNEEVISSDGTNFVDATQIHEKGKIVQRDIYFLREAWANLAELEATAEQQIINLLMQVNSRGDESIFSVINIIFESVLFRFDFVLFNIISF